ncbi:MAG TPA: YiiX/YebB-like N1pC/P60 family cysteine hydrolase [Gammaproteobacteria bacterium]|nr:YiiX/YebB-like N1pC/P60 family cysteine hydrolase [Gammaproteobacteria bacterium]HRP87224.1 YiiX/YebB-like N1pC/P60 family cysteine hydrolase [Gammaproteobacteria bacterium]
MRLLNTLGRRIAAYLSRPRENGGRVATGSRENLAATLQRGDVLLVEGTSLFASAVKYLTQSTWSHAALCVGDALGRRSQDGESLLLVEADINTGVRALPLSEYWDLHTRICRPVGLSSRELDELVAFVVARIGHQYDLKNIWDLARYLMPTPPVPRRWRRKLLALGSGDPTRAICSSLIAQAFGSIGYPILPELYLQDLPTDSAQYREWLHIRHHSLYAPRDFDVSPYFEVVKPKLARGFDHHELDWADTVRLQALDLDGPHVPA